MDMEFWEKKKVFLTGHTGFKGSWLSIWLSHLGADVTGYSLNPPTNPSLFELSYIEDIVKSIIGDIKDKDRLQKDLADAQPEILIHMAAQPLVRLSYDKPLETFETNIMGTANILEAVRNCPTIRSVVIVTTDKCYENKEWFWGYRENEPMGGFDPYSSSKGCAELVTAAYRNSFFNNTGDENYTAIATARAGNVIGGGDWALDRLIPDCMQALLNNQKIIIRNPNAIRPWQHVLEPLHGYLVLAEQLYKNGMMYAESWNFGPEDNDCKEVDYVVSQICNKWSKESEYIVENKNCPHEATFLKLDCSKAKNLLNWTPVWTIDETIDSIIEWYEKYEENSNMLEVCRDQIKKFERAIKE